MTAAPVRVGILSLHTSKETKAILNAVEALGHDPEWLREENVVVEMAGERATLTPDVDVVVNRLLLSNTDQPSEQLGVANTLAALRPMLNPPAATALAAHKIATAATLTGHGVPVPETVFALGGGSLGRYRDRFGDEAVYKTAIGTHGGGAWKVDREQPLTGTVGRRRAFLQEFVAPVGDVATDLRVYVVDGTIVGAMYRFAAAGDWRTNVARGGSVRDATDDLPPGVARMATTAAAAVGLDYAGVDLIEDDRGWYVLEVNPTAGFRGLYEATQVSPAPHIAKLAIERAGATVDADRVDRLAATLDDAEPSCAPRTDAATVDDPVVIGLTERVVVSGTTGTERVTAKADSGAARTSVDIQLAADLGAGPIHKVTRIRTGSRKGGKNRPVVDLVIGLGGNQHTVEANIEDRSHMSHQLLLGRDVLKQYHLDVTRRVEDRATVEAAHEE